MSNAIYVLAFILATPWSAFAIDGYSRATDIPVGVRISLRNNIVVDKDGRTAPLDWKLHGECRLEFNAVLSKGTVISPRTMIINRPVTPDFQAYSGLRTRSRGTTIIFPVVDSYIKAIHCEHIGSDYWIPTISSIAEWFEAVGLKLGRMPPRGLLNGGSISEILDAAAKQ